MSTFTCPLFRHQCIGSFCPSKRLSVRFIVGAMCLSCLVLYQAYSSVLVSTLTLPKCQPLIKSVYDIPKTPSIAVTTVKQSAPDVQFMVFWFLNSIKECILSPENWLLKTSDNGIGKFLGDMLRSDPHLRCGTTEECLKIVRLEKSKVLITVRIII